MNILLLLRVLGAILLVEAAAMVPSFIIALFCGNPGDIHAFALTLPILLAFALPMRFLFRPKKVDLRPREGFMAVALAWVLLSLFGGLPFLFSGLTTNYVDAFFEAVSGFTTTGASILNLVDGEPFGKGVMFWRSFTHWVGGMGVLVLTLAMLPKLTGGTSHLVRAESPGPTLSKIAPRMGDTAKILYLIYAFLTLLQWFILTLAGMSPYDAAIHAMGTAGTGGFSNHAASIGYFNSAAVDWIITFFMVAFGINFVIYYQMLTRQWKNIRENTEVKFFLLFYLAAVLIVTILIRPQQKNAADALRYAAFNVASIISTTGYATTDFALWPAAARMVLVLAMFIGSCAGSTAGGMKACRVGMLCKTGAREIRRTFQPRKAMVVRFDGRAVDETVLRQVAVYAFMYFLLILLGAFVLSFDRVSGPNGPYDITEYFTTALTCVSNVGPGLGAVGPMGNFAGYSPFSKLVMSFLMLAGRLELLPILAMFHPAIWKK